jgi:hypothetical protein
MEEGRFPIRTVKTIATALTSLYRHKLGPDGIA